MNINLCFFLYVHNNWHFDEIVVKSVNFIKNSFINQCDWMWNWSRASVKFFLQNFPCFQQFSQLWWLFDEFNLELFKFYFCLRHTKKPFHNHNCRASVKKQSLSGLLIKVNSTFFVPNLSNFNDCMKYFYTRHLCIKIVQQSCILLKTKQDYNPIRRVSFSISFVSFIQEISI